MVDHEFSNIFAKVYLGMGAVIVVAALFVPPIWFALFPWALGFAFSFGLARLMEWMDRD